MIKPMSIIGPKGIYLYAALESESVLRIELHELIREAPKMEPQSLTAVAGGENECPVRWHRIASILIR